MTATRVSNPTVTDSLAPTRPAAATLERGRLDAGDRVVGEGILTRPRRPARIEEGAVGGSAPASRGDPARAGSPTTSGSSGASLAASTAFETRVSEAGDTWIERLPR